LINNGLTLKMGKFRVDQHSISSVTTFCGQTFVVVHIKFKAESAVDSLHFFVLVQLENAIKFQATLC
jgi:hypothetical protein